MKISKVIILSILLNGAHKAGYANIQGLGQKQGWTVGIAHINHFSAYQGVQVNNTTTLPYLAYSWENLTIDVQGLSYDFYQNQTISLQASLQPRWSFTDPQDSPIFTHIQRDIALEAGIKFAWETQIMTFSAEYLKDISGVHQGSQWSLLSSFEYEVLGIDFAINAGYTHRTSDLNNHLYGLNESEAQGLQNAFNAPSTWQPVVSAEIFISMGQQTGILFFAQYEAIPNSLFASPLLNKKRDANVGIALITKF